MIGILFMQVMVSQSSSFEGDIEGRALRQMPFSEFLAPPATSSPESQHYLAQVPIWSRNCPHETPLEALVPDIVLPAYLDPARSTCLQSINFWMASRCALQLTERQTSGSSQSLVSIVGLTMHNGYALLIRKFTKRKHPVCLDVPVCGMGMLVTSTNISL